MSCPAMTATRRRSFAVPSLLRLASIALLCGCSRQYVQPPFAQKFPAVAEQADDSRSLPQIGTERRRASAIDFNLNRSAEVAENLRRGRQEAESGRPDQAARFYERVLRDDPGHAEAHHRLAVLAADAEDYAVAERHYLAALQSDRENPDLINHLGYSYLLQRRYGEAEQAFRQVLSITDRHESAIANLALLYTTVGAPDQALDVLRLTASNDAAHARLVQLKPFAGVADGERGPSAGQPPVTRPHNAAEIEGYAVYELAHAEIARRETPRPGLIEPLPDIHSRRAASKVALREPYVRRSRDDTSAFGAMPSQSRNEDTASAAVTDSMPSIEPQSLPLWTGSSGYNEAGRRATNDTMKIDVQEQRPAISKHLDGSIQSLGYESRSTSSNRLPPPYFPMPQPSDPTSDGFLSSRGSSGSAH